MARISKAMTSLIIDGEVDTSKARFVAIRDELSDALESKKYPIRVDITWNYQGDMADMPKDDTMKDFTDFEEAVVPSFEKNNLALLAYILTGEGKRVWSFYTRNLNAFETTLNEALNELPLYPLIIHAEMDIEGDAYKEAFSLL